MCIAIDTTLQRIFDPSIYIPSTLKHYRKVRNYKKYMHNLPHLNFLHDINFPIYKTYSYMKHDTILALVLFNFKEWG